MARQVALAPTTSRISLWANCPTISVTHTATWVTTSRPNSNLEALEVLGRQRKMQTLTVSRLGLPAELRRSLACTNIIENMMGTVRRVTRNVKRWSSPSMALRWTAAAMHEAKKGFRRLKAFRQLPALRASLAAHYEKETNSHAVAQNAKAA
jgi:hypothetical protein